MAEREQSLAGFLLALRRRVVVDLDDGQREVVVAERHQRAGLRDARVLVTDLGVDTHVVHRLQARLGHVRAGMAFLDRREREAAEQLVVVGADDVAAERTEVAIAHEPAVHAVHAAHVRNLVLVFGGRARGEQIGRLGEVRVAIDDLDALEFRTQALRGLRVVDFADDSAGLVAFVAPVPARGARSLLVVRHLDSPV